MITFGEARALAEEHLDARARSWTDEEVVINDAQTVTRPACWIFFYNTRIYLETRADTHALAGNSPIVVNAKDGKVWRTISAFPWQEQIEEFERTGIEPALSPYARKRFTEQEPTDGG